MKKLTVVALLSCSPLVALLFLPGPSLAYNTSYFYFNVTDARTGRTCSEVLVNATTQQAKI